MDECEDVCKDVSKDVYTFSVYEDDIKEINTSFWNEKHVPELEDIVEIQDKDIIRSYIYRLPANSESPKWVFQSEVKIVTSVGVNDKEEGNKEKSRTDTDELLYRLKSQVDALCIGKKFKPSKSMDTLREVVQKFIDDNLSSRSPENSNDGECQKVDGTKEKESTETETNTDETNETNKTTEGDMATETTKTAKAAKAAKTTNTNKASKIDKADKTNKTSKASKTDKTDKTPKKKTDEPTKRSEYNIFMSDCLLRLKRDNKDIQPSQRMGVAVQEWHKYKATKEK